MKQILAIAAVALPLVFSGCAQVTAVEKTICTDVAKMPAAAVTVLDAQDTHSAAGQLWAYTKSSCKAGLPVAGVDPEWRGLVWGGLKAAIPVVLPKLVPLLVGLLL